MKPARITLTVAQGSLEGKEYVFEEPARCVIGRADDCDIQFPQDHAHLDISRHHCLLEIEPPTVLVRDLGSRNGTYVNGERTAGGPRYGLSEMADLSEYPAQELKDGDELQLGHTVFRVGIVVVSHTPEPVYFPMGFA